MSYLLSCLFFCFTLFFHPFLSQASVFDDTEDIPLPSNISAVLELAFILDDNVFLEKKATTSDFILESSVFLSHEGDTFFLSALAISDRYRENHHLNYEFYELGLEVPFGKKNTGSLFMNLSPKAPLDKTDTGSPFELASRGLSLLLEREISWGTLGFSFALTHLRYSPPFQSKDSGLVSLGPNFFYVLSQKWTISGDVIFERGRAAGGFIGRFPDDISYRATGVSFQTRHYFSSRMNTRFKYHFRHKRFTSKQNDPIHAGRWDRRHLVGIDAEVKVFKDVYFRSGLEVIRVFSSSPDVEFENQRWLFSAFYVF